MQREVREQCQAVTLWSGLKYEDPRMPIEQEQQKVERTNTNKKINICQLAEGCGRKERQKQRER